MMNMYLHYPTEFRAYFDGIFHYHTARKQTLFRAKITDFQIYIHCHDLRVCVTLRRGLNWLIGFIATTRTYI
jgi:hypothetical protein